MASGWILVIIACSLLIASTQLRCIVADKIDMGVYLGMQSNNLPSPVDMVALYKSNGIGKIRLLRPDAYLLNALRDSDIDVMVGVPNDEIPIVASCQDAAELWFQNNLAPFVGSVNFAFISVGNEAIPGEYAASIPAAMYFLHLILRRHELDAITVTTTVSPAILQNTFPPSAASFTPQAKATMVAVLNFLSKIGSPVLLINVYPYYTYANDPISVGLDFAQFTATQPKFQDKNLSYYNLFDTMVDGFFWAMEKVNVSDVLVSVSETGWPSYGNTDNGDLTTPSLAATYNSFFMKHILSHAGTPKRPGLYIEGFICCMFLENLRPNGVQQNFGLFYPVERVPVYPLFTSS